MKNKVKKLVAAVLLDVTLCGGMLTAQAASSGHVHNSYQTYAGTIRSVNSTHQYVTAINRDTRGNIVGYRYGTCIVTTYLDKYNYVCHDCGTVTGSTTKTRVGHSVHH